MEQLCPWESAQYFVYSSNIPTLFFYSHIPAIIVAILIGLMVFFKSGKSKVGITLLIVNLLFSLWCLFDLILWATNRPDVVMFFWALQILFEPLVYLLCFYLIYVFLKNKDLDTGWKFFGIFLYSPIVLLLPFEFNLIGVDLSYCTAIEGFIAQYYTYAFEATLILSILIFIIWEFRKIVDRNKRKEIVILGFGIILFLVAFSSGNIIGSFTENWTLAQAGLIGMPLFTIFLAYLFVRFHTFNIKVFATQVLMVSIWFLVLGILLIRQIENVRIITAITLILVTIAGDILIKSVKKEIEQKEELEGLNVELQDLLKQRESLMHLINHKVKGSFTRSKFIFAGILDGTFGEISTEIKKMATQGLESDDTGIKTIDLVLNAANMQKGTVKYDLKELDLKDVILKIIADKTDQAETKNLVIEKNIQEGGYKILGDSIWLKEAINNLIENSIKYTKEGKITVNLENKEGKVILSVKDTGVGLTTEDKNILFTEGGRGKDSMKMNVDSTGYGLYSVKLILDAHKGRVWAESEGKDNGSTFFIELPAM